MIHSLMLLLTAAACLIATGGCKEGAVQKEAGTPVSASPVVREWTEATATAQRATPTSVPTLTPTPTPTPSLSPAPVPVSTAPAGRTAYLTFDDGPSDHTDRILDILKREEVRATFFVNGNATAEGIRLYRRIAAEGHAIGNHTYSHSYARIYASVQAYKADTEKLNDLLERAVGFRPDLIRFPGGSNNRLADKAGGKGIMRRIIGAMEAEGYSYVDWNVSSTDAAQAVQPTADIVGAVLGSSRGKRQIIVLMHDAAGKTTTALALPAIIDGLKEQGFRFDKLSRHSFAFRFSGARPGAAPR